jgi:hypothetical protein
MSIFFLKVTKIKFHEDSQVSHGSRHVTVDDSVKPIHSGVLFHRLPNDFAQQ